MHYPGFYRPFFPESIKTILSSVNDSVNYGKPRHTRATLILRQHKKYGSEGVVYFNYLTGEVFIMAAELPSLDFMQSTQYVAFIKRKDMEEYVPFILSRNQDSLWIGRGKVEHSLETLSEIIICGTSNQELQQGKPAPSKIVLIGDFCNLIFPVPKCK